MSGDNKVGARIHLLKLGGFVVPVTLAFAVLDDAQSINPQVAYPNLSTNEGGIPNRLWLLAVRYHRNRIHRQTNATTYLWQGGNVDRILQARKITSGGFYGAGRVSPAITQRGVGDGIGEIDHEMRLCQLVTDVYKSGWCEAGFRSATVRVISDAVVKLFRDEVEIGVLPETGTLGYPGLRQQPSIQCTPGVVQ
jgi:hypothetical protein